MKTKVVFLIVLSLGMSLNAPAMGWAEPIPLQDFSHNEWVNMSRERQIGLVYGFLLGNLATVKDLTAYNPEHAELFDSYVFYGITGDYLLDVVDYIYSFPRYREVPLYAVISNFDTIMDLIKEGENNDGLQYENNSEETSPKEETLTS